MEKAKDSIPRGKIIAASLILIFGAALIFSAALWGAPSIFAVTLWDNRAQNPAPIYNYTSEQFDASYTVNGYRMKLTTIITSDEHMIISPSEAQVEELLEYASYSNGRVLIKMDQNSYTELNKGGLSQTFRVGNAAWYKSPIQLLLYTDYSSMEITDQMISAVASYERNIDFTMSRELEFNIYHNGESIWTEGLVSMRIGIPNEAGEQIISLSAATATSDDTDSAADTVSVTDNSEGWSYVVITSPGQYSPTASSGADSEDEGSVGYVVTANSLNVRSGPGMSYGKISSVKNNDIVNVVNMDGGWAEILLGEGKTGWVYTKYLELVMG